MGCHELRSNAPQNASRSIASLRAPSGITPPPWKDQTISWKRYVRPVLDKYCAECHMGDGEAVDKLNLTFRKGTQKGRITGTRPIGYSLGNRSRH